MSSDPAPTYPPQGPSSGAVPLSENQPPADLPAPPPAVTSLKPLLNPLQTNDTPPASTLVEPPRSPNPQNPATDEIGNNTELDLPSASVSVVGPGEVVGESSLVAPVSEPAPVEGVNGIVEQNGHSSSTVASPAPAVSREDSAQPPLPRDAPVPPTPPQPTDEAPPTIGEGVIPPAVSTPTVITTEDQDVQMDGSAQSGHPLAPTGPVGGSTALPPTPPTPLDTPAPVDAPTEVPASTSSQTMEVDAHGEPESVSAGMESRGSEGSLKRAGEDLEGREEKRVKEDPAPAPAPAAAVPTPLPTTQPPPPVLPPVAVDPNAPPPPWITYVEPPHRPAGPTTPFTPTQHKHLLASVRSLKKNKDAINFLKPVDVVLFGIPHYAQIITKPMDLETVETKLIVSDPRGPPKDKSKMSKWDTSKGSYHSVSNVVQDVRQIWENTRKFNGPDHVVSQAAKKLDDSFEKMLSNLPPEPVAALPPPPPPTVPSPAAGPSHPRRPSVSQPPAIRRSSEGLADSRPKREIHPPPSKDLNYHDGGARKPKRRNDPQLQWVSKTIKGFETTNKHYTIVSPFIYPVGDIIAALPHYTQVIKKPIDLIQIKAKLDNGDYDEVSQVDADMRLMIKNALTFNRPGDEVHTAAAQLQQLWDEKWRLLPPKQEARDTSEDPLAEDLVEADESDEEDANLLRRLEAQLVELQNQITEVKARRARRPKGGKPKPKNKVNRKQSVTKMSPGVNGNGHAKKPRKSKEIVYRDDDDAESEDEQPTTITLTQKQELAQKIQEADEETLKKAIAIIQQTTSLGQNDEEIELDIDSLPQGTVLKLYNLVCRGNRKLGRPKGIPGKKPGRKATGGASRKTMNEQEEADRIARMEAQLQSFDSGRGNVGAYEGGEESDSSDDESSDED